MVENAGKPLKYESGGHVGWQSSSSATATDCNHRGRWPSDGGGLSWTHKRSPKEVINIAAAISGLAKPRHVGAAYKRHPSLRVRRPRRRRPLSNVFLRCSWTTSTRFGAGKAFEPPLGRVLGPQAHNLPAGVGQMITCRHCEASYLPSVSTNIISSGNGVRKEIWPGDGSRLGAYGWLHISGHRLW
ncbi:hypothetical protein SCHPADRAFT_717011 [Schizopora paradoxa]|uniref:Uncharacterized protein n=1 Tax=Schizopora paradoxa TaxID=27342 RepID=A0A0H2RLH2_9AGAM|nr:hypothetical protein SCHPADRAFT_717011 [Schizopora paradoxa]